MIIRILFLLILIFFIFSCKKKEEQEYTDQAGEAVYTDTFSPPEWENPASRNKLKAEDKDIGRIIEDDIMDPRLRKIMKLIEGFIKNIRLRNLDEIEKILTSSAFNTFNLRFPEINLPDNYNLRIAYPGFVNEIPETNSSGDNKAPVPSVVINTPLITQNNSADKIFVEFKLIYQTVSIISKLEVEMVGEDYKISDFENKFFDEIKDLPNEKNKAMNKKKK
jgi:hypothetical protein